jgi:hypothetical protein
MKKFVAGLLCGVMFAAGVTAVFAAVDNRLVINGLDVTEDMTVKPQIVDGEAVVPVSAVAEALGLSFNYDSASGLITLDDGRLGLDDLMADGEMTVRELLSSQSSQLNVDAIYDALENSEAAQYLLQGFEPEIALSLIVEDYISWASGKTSLLPELWENFYLPSEDTAAAETVEFDNLEITVGGDIEFVTYDNTYSEHDGKTLIQLPLSIKNLSDKSHSLNFMYCTFYGSKGTEAEDVNLLIDDSFFNAGKIRPGVTQETFVYILYDGDGEYVIEFSDWLNDPIEVILQIEQE